MKAKTLLALLISGILVISAACSTPGQAEPPAQNADNSANASVATPPELSPPVAGDFAGALPNQDSLAGKVLAVSDNAITVALAVVPERGEPRNGDTPSGSGTPAQPDGESPAGRQEQNGTERPQGEAPLDRGQAPGGQPGAQPGSMMRLEFSEDTTTYAIADGVVVTKGRVEDEEAIGVGELAAGDIVIMELNDGGQVIAIRLMDFSGGEAMQQPNPDEEPLAN